MIVSSTTAQEMQALDKLQHYIANSAKQLAKLTTQDNPKQLLSNLESIVYEICFLLQARDLNEFGSTITKLFAVWKDLLKILQKPDQVIPKSMNKIDLQQKLESQLSEFHGQLGRFGGVKVSQLGAPVYQAENKLLRQSTQSNFPVISPRVATEGNSERNQIKYDLDENQRCLLQEVLRQSNRLNVQIVMKRYDPKIKLCLSQYTDTGLDVVEAMRGFRKELHENKLNEIIQDNEIHMEELQKIINAKVDYSALIPSGVTDKLKIIYKSINSRSQDLELAIMETQKNQPDMVKNTLNEFVLYVNDTYKDIQIETYQIIMKYVEQFLKKMKQENEIKSPSPSVQTGSMSNQKTKDRQSKGSVLKKVDEQADRFKLEINQKSTEIERKLVEINDLQNKIKLQEMQYTQLSLELESLKMTENKTEQDRMHLLYENKKLEKQLSFFNTKTYQDEAVQVSDQPTQQNIAKLQKENQELSQKIYNLQAEIAKLSGRQIQEQRSIQLEQEKSGDPFTQDSKHNSRFPSARDLDIDDYIPPSDKNISVSSRQIKTDRTIRQYVKQSTQQAQPQQYYKDNTKSGKSAFQQQDTKSVKSPRSDSDLDQASQQYLQRPYLDKQQSIIEQTEEENLKSSSQLGNAKRSQLKHTSSKRVMPFKNSPQSNLEIDVTQAGTIIDSYMTNSGRQIQTERTKDGKFNRIEKSPSGRRIQTEIAVEQIKSDQLPIQRSTTQIQSRQSNRKKGTSKYDRTSTQGFNKDVFEENSCSNQNSIIEDQLQLQKATSPTKNQLTVQVNQNIRNSIMERQKSTPNLKVKIDSQFQRSSTIQNQQQSQSISQKQKSSSSQQQLQQQQQQQNKQQYQQDNKLQTQKSQENKGSVEMKINVNDDKGQTLIQETHKFSDQQDLAEQQVSSDKQVQTADQQNQTDDYLLKNVLEQLISKLSLSSDQIAFIQKEMTQTLNYSQKVSRENLASNHSSESLDYMKHKYDQGQLSKYTSQRSIEKHINRIDETEKEEVSQSYYMQNNKNNASRSMIKQDSKNQSKNSIAEEKQNCKTLEDEQEFIITMGDMGNLDAKPYDELQKEIITKENDGKPLEILKINDLKGDQLVQRLYHNLIVQKKTEGAKLVFGMLQQFYKKGKHEHISYSEFFGFYSKLAAKHKQCGQAVICNHLQRFIMRLGFTCTQFSRRQILKPSLSQVKPFEQTKQVPIKQSTQGFSSSRYQNNKYFVPQDLDQ